MRIDCEICSATYTIDDAQLSDQPIGAQCPYCGHVRLVQRLTSFGSADAARSGVPGLPPTARFPPNAGPSSGLGLDAFGAPQGFDEGGGLPFSDNASSFGPSGPAYGAFSSGPPGRSTPDLSPDFSGLSAAAPGSYSAPPPFGASSGYASPDLSSGPASYDSFAGLGTGSDPASNSFSPPNTFGAYGSSSNEFGGSMAPPSPQPEAALGLHAGFGSKPKGRPLDAQSSSYQGGIIERDRSDDSSGGHARFGAPAAGSAFGSEDLLDRGSSTPGATETQRKSAAPGVSSSLSSSPTPGATLGEGDSSCQVCGVPLADEFDKVIGLCDRHQRESRGEGGDEVSISSSRDGAGTWYVRHKDGRSDGPLTLEELRQRIRAGEYGTTQDFSPDGIRFAALATFKEIAYLARLRLNQPIPAGPRSSPGTFRPRSKAASLAVPLLALVCLCGLAVVGFAERARLVRLARSIFSSSPTMETTIPNPLRRTIAMWRQSRPTVSGTLHEHLMKARARHLEDTRAGYEAAEVDFQSALLLDEDDAMAIAGYVENAAMWRYWTMTPDEVQMMHAAVRYATELAPQDAAVYRAQGALALAAGDLSGCRGGADRAVEKDATDGRAKLILAGCYLEGNVLLSIEEAERARQLVPELRRAHRVLAEAYAKVGRYASAFRLLDDRLKQTPNEGSVHVLYAQLARQLGKRDLAEQHGRRAVASGDDPVLAHLALGDLEMERADYAAAAAAYRRAAESPSVTGVRAAQALGAWAKAELERRNASRAAELAEAALKHDPRDAAVLITRGEAALLEGLATNAAAMGKRALEIRAGEPTALVLAGRALAAQKQKQQAIHELELAITNDPSDPRLKGVLAAMYLALGGAPQAYALMRKAADVDPRMAESRRLHGRFALSSIPVREAIEQLKKSADEERNAAVAEASIGLLCYYLGERDAAKAAIQRALDADSGNFTALAYEAQLALDVRDAATALASARKLLAVERGSALGHLLVGRALAMLGKLDDARTQLDSALRADPSLIGARIELAEIALSTGDRDVAIAALEEAYQSDPSRIDARLALFRAGR